MYIILKNGTHLVCKLGYAIKREIRNLIPGRAHSSTESMLTVGQIQWAPDASLPAVTIGGLK